MTEAEFDFSILDVGKWSDNIPEPYAKFINSLQPNLLDLYDKIRAEIDFSFCQFLTGMMTFTKTSALRVDYSFTEVLPEEIIVQGPVPKQEEGGPKEEVQEAPIITLKYVVTINNVIKNYCSIVYVDPNFGDELFYVYDSVDSVFGDTSQCTKMTDRNIMANLVKTYPADMCALLWSILSDNDKMQMFVKQFNNWVVQLKSGTALEIFASRKENVEFKLENVIKSKYYDTAFKTDNSVMVFTNRAKILELGGLFESLYFHSNYSCQCEWLNIVSTQNGVFVDKIIQENCNKVMQNTSMIKIINVRDIKAGALYVILCINGLIEISIDNCGDLTLEELFIAIEHSPCTADRLKMFNNR